MPYAQDVPLSDLVVPDQVPSRAETTARVLVDEARDGATVLRPLMVSPGDDGAMVVRSQDDQALVAALQRAGVQRVRVLDPEAAAQQAEADAKTDAAEAEAAAAPAGGQPAIAAPEQTSEEEAATPAIEGAQPAIPGQSRSATAFEIVRQQILDRGVLTPEEATAATLVLQRRAQSAGQDLLAYARESFVEGEAVATGEQATELLEGTAPVEEAAPVEETVEEAAEEPERAAPTEPVDADTEADQELDAHLEAIRTANEMRAATRADTEQRMATEGWQEGAKVWLPEQNPETGQRVYRQQGRVTINRDGNAFVAGAGQEFSLFANEWTKVGEEPRARPAAEPEKTQVDPATFADVPELSGAAADSSEIVVWEGNDGRTEVVAGNWRAALGRSYRELQGGEPFTVPALRFREADITLEDARARAVDAIAETKERELLPVVSYLRGLPLDQQLEEGKQTLPPSLPIKDLDTVIGLSGVDDAVFAAVEAGRIKATHAQHLGAVADRNVQRDRATSFATDPPQTDFEAELRAGGLTVEASRIIDDAYRLELAQESPRIQRAAERMVERGGPLAETVPPGDRPASAGPRCCHAHGAPGVVAGLWAVRRAGRSGGQGSGGSVRGGKPTAERAGRPGAADHQSSRGGRGGARRSL